MSEAMKNAAYDDQAVRPGFYVPGFDPQQFLRASTDEEGQQELTLDVKHRKHWFRLIHPNGKIMTELIEKDERHAVFNARVYADRADPAENFLAEGKAERFAPADPTAAKPYELYFSDWAETVAIGRALSNAGFDLPFVNVTNNGMTIDPLTGEVVGNPPASAVPTQQAPAQPAQRQYSDRTAPPVKTGALIEPPAKQIQTQPVNGGAITMPTTSGQQTFDVQLQPEPRNEEEALQMPLEWALGYPVQVGAFAGKKLSDVATQNPGALNWYVKSYRGNDFKLRAAAQILLNHAMAKAG